MRRSVHLNNFLVAATSFTTDCVAPNVDETKEVASSTHVQVTENRMQFVDENGGDRQLLHWKMFSFITEYSKRFEINKYAKCV